MPASAVDCQSILTHLTSLTVTAAIAATVRQALKKAKRSRLAFWTVPLKWKLPNSDFEAVAEILNDSYSGNPSKAQIPKPIFKDWPGLPKFSWPLIFQGAGDGNGGIVLTFPGLIRQRMNFIETVFNSYFK